MKTLVLDPGLRAAGVSLWQDGVLQTATVIRLRSRVRDGEGWVPMARKIVKWAGPVDLLVYERMVYLPEWASAKGGHGVVDDLLQLTGLTGVVIGLLNPPRIVAYTPLQWKNRGETKHQTAHDMPLRLSVEERGAYRDGVRDVPEGLKHNAIDAVAIGSFHHQRKKIYNP